MWIVFDWANSHTPSPPTRRDVAVTAATRARPPSAIRPPRITNGIVLPIRCDQEPCRNGEKTMPSSPSDLRAGRMP